MNTDHADRRLRHAVQLKALVSRSDGGTCTSAVTDLSLDGCCIAGDFAIGERVELTVEPIGLLTGQIRWAFAGKAGVRFAKREADVKGPR